MKFVLCMQLSSSNFLSRTGGSSRRAAAVSSGRDAIAGSEADQQRTRTAEASPGAVHKIPSGQRSSPVSSSEHKRAPSGRNSSHTKNYESTLKGIEGLNFESDERVQY